MGIGIDLARTVSPQHAAALESMKDQLLIVFLKRLGGVADIPVAEIDATGQDVMKLSLNIDAGIDAAFFHFELGKKS